jgi:hypothetical protein
MQPPTINQLNVSILKPGKIILMLYGVLSLVFIILYVYRFSFVWEFLLGVTFYVIGLLVAILIGLVIAVKADKKFNWRLKQYAIISLIQLLVVWSIANPIRTRQINSSFEKARLIIDPLNTYKKQFGIYPKTLEELQQTLKLQIPSRTNIGTRYWYESDNGQDYRLWFHSYYGYSAFYNNEKNKWVMGD